MDLANPLMQICVGGLCVTSVVGGRGRRLDNIVLIVAYGRIGFSWGWREGGREESREDPVTKECRSACGMCASGATLRRMFPPNGESHK